MRCPDCGYLLLDPQAHCPKCEKTLAGPGGPEPTSESAMAPADETSGTRSYPSLRLHGQRMSQTAMALAFDDDDSSEPNLGAPCEPGPVPHADLRVVDSAAGQSDARAQSQGCESAPEESAEEDTLIIAADELAHPFPRGPAPEVPLSENELSVSAPATDLAGGGGEGAPDAAAPGEPLCLEEAVADLSISLTGKVGEDAGKPQVEEISPGVFGALRGALPKEHPGAPEEVSEWSVSEMIAASEAKAIGSAQEAASPPVPGALSAPEEAESSGEIASVGARTGEIPPPAAYRAPEPAAPLPHREESDDPGSAGDEAGDVTRVSAPDKALFPEPEYSHPSIDRYASTHWPGRTQTVPLGPPLERPPAAGADPTQISFPKFAPPPPPEEYPSAEYPTAEIVGEASGLAESRPTLRGKALGRRLLAFAADNVATLLLALGFLAAAHWTLGVPLPLGPRGARAGGISGGEFAVAILALRLVLDACYQIGYLVACGHTPGKRLLGLKVEDGRRADRRPGLAQAARRWAWSYALTFGICWGYLTVRRDPWGRALHDRKAGTRILPA